MYQRDRRKQGMQQYGFMGPKPLDPIQGISAPPAAAPQQGALSQFGDMAKQRLMTTALNKGTEQGTALLSSVFNPATTGAASGAMGALGTAMPYVGMGVLGAKMLGLFSKGGKVGPLAKATYAANGEKIGLEFLEEYNSKDMSELSPLTKASIRQRVVSQASKLNPEDRAKYVESLRARGITPDTMYGGNNKNTSILEQFFGIK